MFRPKGSMCINCKKILTCDVKMLDFSKMPILEKDDGDGWTVVKCTSFEKKDKQNNNYFNNMIKK